VCDHHVQDRDDSDENPPAKRRGRVLRVVHETQLHP
jgi:hypothetical protein